MKRTNAPTLHSRICNGATVMVSSGPHKGKTGIAWIFVTSMWSVKMDGGGTATLHRKQLKRVVETMTEVQVAA